MALASVEGTHANLLNPVSEINPIWPEVTSSKSFLFSIFDVYCSIDTSEGFLNKLNDRLVTESNFSPWQRYNEVQDSWAVFSRNSRSLYRKRHENHRYFSKIPKFFWQLIKSELPKLTWRVMITNGPILFPLSYSNIIFMKSHECAFPKYK